MTSTHSVSPSGSPPFTAKPGPLPATQRPPSTASPVRQQGASSYQGTCSGRCCLVGGSPSHRLSSLESFMLSPLVDVTTRRLYTGLGGIFSGHLESMLRAMPRFRPAALMRLKALTTRRAKASARATWDLRTRVARSVGVLLPNASTQVSILRRRLSLQSSSPAPLHLSSSRRSILPQCHGT